MTRAMGVDIVFKARPHVPFTAEQFDALRAKLHDAWPDEDADPEYGRDPDLEWDPYEDAPTMEVNHWWRYYGVGYERGDWPDIKRLGDWLAVELGELAELRYGGDSDDSWEALRPWGKIRDQLQAHWDAHGNEPYRAAFRR